MVTRPAADHAGVERRAPSSVPLHPDDARVDEPRAAALLEAFGAEVVLTPEAGRWRGRSRARRRSRRRRRARSCRGSSTTRRTRAPTRDTTAREILDAMEGLAIDAFVAGVGTGGTISGVGEVLRREVRPAPRIIGVEPASCATISRGERGPTKIQGLAAGFVPRQLPPARRRRGAHGHGRGRVGARRKRSRSGRGSSSA